MMSLYIASADTKRENRKVASYHLKLGRDAETCGWIARYKQVSSRYRRKMLLHTPYDFNAVTRRGWKIRPDGLRRRADRTF